METTPSKTPAQRGVRTAIQTLGGAIVTYIAGLIALPAVQEYTSEFVRTQGAGALATALLALGVSAGLVAYVQNRIESRR